MRRYGRIVSIIMLLAGGMWFALPVFFATTQTWLQTLQVADKNTLSSTASSSLVYLLNTEQWLEFVLPEDSSQLRIITNAHIKAAEATSLEPNWNYALHYELLDKQGAVLRSGLYHQHSRLTAYKNAQGESVYNSYYANKDLLPLDGRFILLGQYAMKGASVLRLRFETINPVMTETAVRVYVPTKMAEHRVETAWLRMNQEQKDNLAKYSIYPAALLSASEKLNLAKHQWQPIGPSGIEDKDYTTLSLYSLKDKEIDEQDAPLIVAAGLQADANHYGVLAIPEQGGQVALSFKALDGSALINPVTVNLQWSGRELAQRWQQNAVWSKDTGDLHYPLDGGLLVIRVDSPVIITATLSTATEAKLDISDALLAIKSYLANRGVVFDILHYQQQPAALRLDVRRLFTPIASAAQKSVHYQWLNAQQQIIASGELTALDLPSLFDRVGDITEPNNVSDPVSYYFHVPNEVTQLRLSSNNPDLLVSAYNQPYKATKTLRVPEDAYINNDKQNIDLTWFPLRATNEETLTQQVAVPWISAQYRPPEDKPDVLAGQYDWQDFIPEANNASRYILTDYSNDEPRADALASVYCSLAVNRDVRVKLAAFHGLRSVAPELIFLRDKANPFTAELFANNEKVLVTKSMGRQGSVSIPETALGAQSLRLNTNSGGRWLMNYQADCQGEQYLKRRVFALNTPLEFIVQHGADDEVLSARLYTPAHTVDRSHVQVTIEAMNSNTQFGLQHPANNWTFTNRLYDIRPLASKPMPVLHTQGQTLSNGERFAIPLNSDLPAGAYRIRLALTQGSAGFVTLSQVKAGVYEQRRFFKETQLDANRAIGNGNSTGK